MIGAGVGCAGLGSCGRTTLLPVRRAKSSAKSAVTFSKMSATCSGGRIRPGTPTGGTTAGGVGFGCLLPPGLGGAMVLSPGRETLAVTPPPLPTSGPPAEVVTTSKPPTAVPPTGIDADTEPAPAAAGLAAGCVPGTVRDACSARSAGTGAELASLPSTGNGVSPPWPVAHAHRNTEPTIPAQTKHTLAAKVERPPT